MENESNVNKSVDKKKNAVPHIKISGAKNDGKTSTVARNGDKGNPAKSRSNQSLSVTPSGRTRSRDANYRKDLSTEPNGSSARKINSGEESKNVNQTTKITSKVLDRNGISHTPSKDKPGKIPMRRCASIDVGELGRKKKSKRSKKKHKVDTDALKAIHTASIENVGKGQAQESGKRSGSLGARPNTLKLAQTNIATNYVNANSVFPTPVPSKRHSNIEQSDEDPIQNSTILISPSTEVTPNDKSAILPTKTKDKQKRIKTKKERDESATESDTDESWHRNFPTGSGYRKHGRKHTFPSSPYNRIVPPIIKKSWLHTLAILAYVFLAFTVFCPIAAILLVLFPVCVFVKFFLNCCSVCCYCESNGCCVCGQRLSVTEKFWVQNELHSPQVAQSLIIVEFGLSVPQIVNLINNRLVLAASEDGSRLYPKFTQKVVQTCSDYIWQEDKTFFIHNHVFAMPKGIESLEDIQDYISDLASRPLMFGRPLWEIQILTDFGDARDTVILLRLHPCVADGVSMVKILYKSIADVDSVTTVPPKLGKPSCLNTFKSVVDGPIKFFGRILSRKSDFNLLHGHHVHLSGKQVVTWSEPFSLAYATKIKQVSKSTLNEVFLSVAAGSIRNYLMLNGIPHPYDMQTSIPVYYGPNIHEPSSIGNDVLLLQVNLPTNTEGVVPRLWQMKKRMNQARESALFAITRRVFKFTHHILSASVWNKLWIYILRKCTCIISSLPGPEINLRMCSKQIKTIFYWFPPVRQAALTINFFTYGDHIQLAVSADRSVLPNPELLARDFIYQMQTLYEQLGHRRIPGEHLASKKLDLAWLNMEIKPEETASQLQTKMSMIHQELQNLKHKLDSGKYDQADEDLKLLKRIETLKEQFRELLVEMRKRKAAESELAMTFSEEDSTEDDDEFDLPRRPFRRRAMSVSSRMSTASVSSTVRPLPAPTPSITPDYSPDSPLITDKQVPYTSYSTEKRFNTIPYSRRRPSTNRMEELEILEYQYSPSLERRQYNPLP